MNQRAHSLFYRTMKGCHCHIKHCEVVQPILKWRSNQEQSSWGGGDSSVLKMACDSWERLLAAWRMSKHLRPPSRLSHLTQIYEQLDYCRAAIATTKCCWVTSSWQHWISALWHACGFIFFETWLITCAQAHTYGPLLHVVYAESALILCEHPKIIRSCKHHHFCH